MLKRVVFILALLAVGPAPATWAAQERITFAYSAISPDMAGVWMAKDMGAFERHGLSVDLVYISSGATVIQALVGGSVQAALGASNAVVSAVLKGAPILAVGGNTTRPTMVLWVQPEISRAEQLQGKTLAITRFGSTTDFVARLMLKRLGLDGRVDLRPFGGVVEADMGFRARHADGRVSSQPPGPQARKLVDAAELEIPLADDFLAVGSDFYKKSRASVEGILMGYIEGIAALKTKKQKALDLLAKYMRQRGGSLDMHYEFVLKYLDSVPRVEPAGVETILQMASHSGPVEAKIFDNSIVEKLSREGFIDQLYKERAR